MIGWKKVRWTIGAISLGLWLVGCQGGLMTPLEESSVTLMSTPLPLATPQPTEMLSLQPESTITPIAISSPAGTTPTPPCEMATAGTPLDVTVPDDTAFPPGQRFIKTWRLVNNGSCAWDETYAVVWVSGAELSLWRSQPLMGRVLPGSSVDISVEMMAPMEQGRYTSYWMLRSPSGRLFGLGPSGNAPFWVRIQVLAINTPTYLPSPTPSPTIPALIEGRVRLQVNQGLDLDDGIVVGESSAADLWFEHTDAIWRLTAARGLRWGWLPEADSPSAERCLELAVNDQPIKVEDAGNRLICLHSPAGLPGYLRVIFLDQERGQVEVNFLIWPEP